VGTQECTGSTLEDEALEDVDPDNGCLSEVLAYLSEPANDLSVSGKVAANKGQHQSNEDPEVQDSIITKLNSALQEVAETYKDDAGEEDTHNAGKSLQSEAECYSRDIVDADTTSSSVSALSDSENALTEVSYSESVSPHESVKKRQQFGQEEEKCHHPLLPGKRRDASSPRIVSNKAATVDTLRMARSLLNKLTRDRFESICSQILSLPLSTPEQLAVLVAEIFHKATTQDCFRMLYTEMCMRLDAHLATSTGEIGGRAFRKALVSECQATFERDLQQPDAAIEAGLDDDERFEIHMKLKTRRLGNMRFIGDLLVQHLLAPKLLSPIVHELLNGDETSFESLVALLSVVAPEFEKKPVLYHAPVRDAMASLSQKVSEDSVCPRMRYQIKDLLDAKARGWRSRSIVP
jgi:translation initiation factor 4G